MYTLEQVVDKLVRHFTKVATLYRVSLEDTCVKNTRIIPVTATKELSTVLKKKTIISINNEYNGVSFLNAVFKIDKSTIIAYNKFRESVYKNPVDQTLENASSGEDKVVVPRLDLFHTGMEVDVVNGNDVESKEVLDYSVQDEGVREVQFTTPLSKDFPAGSLVVHKNFQCGFMDVKCKTIFGTPDREFYTVEPDVDKPYTAILIRAVSLVEDYMREPKLNALYSRKKGAYIPVSEIVPYKLRLRVLIRANNEYTGMGVYSQLMNKLTRAFSIQVGSEERHRAIFIRKDNASSLDVVGDDNGISDNVIEYEGIIYLKHDVYEAYKILQNFNFIFTKYNTGA